MWTIEPTCHLQRNVHWSFAVKVESVSSYTCIHQYRSNKYPLVSHISFSFWRVSHSAGDMNGVKKNCYYFYVKFICKIIGWNLTNVTARSILGCRATVHIKFVISHVHSFIPMFLSVLVCLLSVVPLVANTDCQCDVDGLWWEPQKVRRKSVKVLHFFSLQINS